MNGQNLVTLLGAGFGQQLTITVADDKVNNINAFHLLLLNNKNEIMHLRMHMYDIEYIYIYIYILVSIFV